MCDPWGENDGRSLGKLKELKEFEECQCMIFLCECGHGVPDGSSFTFLVRTDTG